MLKVQGGRYPFERPWVKKLCGLVRHNRVVRERFGIRRMDEFEKFVRIQPLWLLKRSIRALEAGRASSQLLDAWVRLSAAKASEGEALHQAPRPGPKVEQPASQLHLLPFWAGIRGFNL